MKGELKVILISYEVTRIKVIFSPSLFEMRLFKAYVVAAVVQLGSSILLCETHFAPGTVASYSSLYIIMRNYTLGLFYVRCT